MENNNFMQLVLSYEQQGVNRLAIMELVKPEIEAIDKQRKDIKETIETGIKALGAVDAVKACNAICPTVSGADNSARQRLSRRRNWLKSLLSKVHKDYDFSLVDGTIFADYIGESEVRQAKTLIGALEQLVELELIDFPELSLDDVVQALKASKQAGAAVESLHVDSTTVLAIHDIANRAAELTAKLGTTASEKVAEQQKEKAA